MSESASVQRDTAGAVFRWMGHIHTKDCVFTNVRRGEAKMKISAVTMGQLEDFLETIASKYTRKNYVYGIKKFEEWYGNSITKLVKSPDATKTVEKFFVFGI